MKKQQAVADDDIEMASVNTKRIKEIDSAVVEPEKERKLDKNRSIKNSDRSNRKKKKRNK